MPGRWCHPGSSHCALWDVPVGRLHHPEHHHAVEEASVPTAWQGCAKEAGDKKARKVGAAEWNKSRVRFMNWGGRGVRLKAGETENTTSCALCQNHLKGQAGAVGGGKRRLGQGWNQTFSVVDLAGEVKKSWRIHRMPECGGRKQAHGEPA